MHTGYTHTYYTHAYRLHAHTPQDDPADFSYFFNSSSRRSCYLAPERFVEPASLSAPSLPTPHGATAHTAGMSLTPAMDIFSVGCVLIELLREGETCFDLPQLLRYRRGALDPATGLLQDLEPALAKAAEAGGKHGKAFAQLLREMTSRSPTERPTAEQCLMRGRGGFLPEVFSSLVHPFFGAIRLLDHTRQAEHLCERVDELVRALGPSAGGGGEGGEGAHAAECAEGGLRSDVAHAGDVGCLHHDR